MFIYNVYRKNKELSMNLTKEDLQGDSEMNLYRVDRQGETNYDEYDSFVCVAKDEEEARYLHP